jgi:hypothetical protein
VTKAIALPACLTEGVVSEEGLAAAAPLVGVIAIEVEVGALDGVLLQEVLSKNDEISPFASPFSTF